MPAKDPNPLMDGNYQTDVFNRNPLFKIDFKNKNKSCFVRDWGEAFGLIEKVSFEDISPKYLAAFITENYDMSVSPYKNIKRFKRARSIQLKNDEVFNYSKNIIFETSETKYTFKELSCLVKKEIFNSIEEIVNSNLSNYGIEHSSGLDSNIILGTLVKGLKISKKELVTWSSEGMGELELIKKFRKFYSLYPKNCIEVKSLENYSNDNYLEIIKILGFPQQILSSNTPTQDFFKNDCKVIFSGFGGDQAFSHKANNVVTDLVFDLRWLELNSWTQNNYVTAKNILSRFYYRINPEWARKRIKKTIMPHSNFLIKFLTPVGKNLLTPFLKERFFPHELDYFPRLGISMRNRILSDWVSIRMEEETRISKHYNIKKFFPFLNENLISILVAQDPIFFSKNINQGRYLARKTFEKVLPEFLVNNPSKIRNFDLDQYQEKFKPLIKNKIYDLLSQSFNWNYKINELWDIPVIRDNIYIILENKNLDYLKLISAKKELDKLHALNLWFNLF